MASQKPCNASGRFYQAFYHWGRQIEQHNSLQCPVYQANRHTSTLHLRRPSPNKPYTQSRKNSTFISSYNIAAPVVTTKSSASEESQHSPPSQPSKQPPELSHYMRWLMRRIPQSVVAITASSSSDTAKPTPRAMTLSSFTTVTLTPKPYISFNIRKPSSTYDAISSLTHDDRGARGGDFLVHLLSASPAGSRIAELLARGNAEDALRQLSGGGTFSIQEEHGADVLPLIHGDGVLAVLHCRTLPDKELEVGDHVVLVAEVLSTVTAGKEVGEGQHSGPDPKKLGLAYCMREYLWQDGTGFALSTTEGEGKEKVDDVYVYEKDEESPKPGNRVRSSGDALRTFRGKLIVGKRVNATHVPAKRRPQASGRSSSGNEDGAKEKATEAKDGATSEDELEIQRTLGLNVRRGDEGFS